MLGRLEQPKIPPLVQILQTGPALAPNGITRSDSADRSATAADLRWKQKWAPGYNVGPAMVWPG